MATPHVTGTAALLLSEHPSLTYSQVKSKILSTTTATTSLSGKTTTGGRLNAAAVLNDPPVLTAIPDQTIDNMHTAVVTLSASDPDGDSLTYTATVANLAYTLKTTYGLFSDGNLYFNYGGVGDKWVQGSGGKWYFILPTGDFYLWDGTSGSATGTLLATLAPGDYADPSLIYNAAPAGSTSISGTTLTVSPTPAGFLGKLVVTVTAKDAYASDTKTFAVTVITNIPPVLSSIPNQTISHTQTTFTYNLSGSDPDGDPLTFSASAQSLAYVLFQSDGFFTDGNFYQNYFGSNEKWVQGSGGVWYFVLPTGDFYLWDGSNAAKGTYLGNVGSSYWDDPNRLINPPANQAHATVSVVGNTLTVVRDTTWTAAMVITATVSDGFSTDSKSFTLTVT
jgi:hypothetical protein